MRTTSMCLLLISLGGCLDSGDTEDYATTQSAVSASQDVDTARAITSAGAPFGWSARYLPPDPLAPPDPLNKPRITLTTNTSVRPDLDQQFVLAHQDGLAINPCIRVLHRYLPDGSMFHAIDLVDAEGAVKITVPAGYALVPVQGGYALAPAR